MATLHKRYICIKCGKKIIVPKLICIRTIKKDLYICQKDAKEMNEKLTQFFNK